MGRPRGKLSKGQPRGNRSASGRKRNLVAEREVSGVTPCDGVVRRRELYHLPANDTGEPDAQDRKHRRQQTDTTDAIGRAYCAGLLGTGERADRLLNAGRRIHAQYWRHYGSVEPGLTRTPDSLARWQPRLGGGEPDPERDRIIEDALNDALSLVSARGRYHRAIFDQLVVDFHPDHGPPWLDAIVWAHRHSKRATERDYALLGVAIEALEAVS